MAANVLHVSLSMVGKLSNISGSVEVGCPLWGTNGGAPLSVAFHISSCPFYLQLNRAEK